MKDTYREFVVFEGLDGAGTTTQIKRLAEKFEKNGRKVFLTHEPTDNPIGRVVRDVLQHKFRTTPAALALLYASDRDDHLKNPVYGIERQISEGKIVLSDRYFYSSIAYQGVDLDVDFVKSINPFPHAGFLIFIDTSAESCMKRIEKRGEEKELFEKYEFLKKVRENYLKQLESVPEGTNVLVLDGELSIDEIEKRIWDWISPYFL